MRKVSERSLKEGRITLKVPPSKKIVLRKAAEVAEEEGIPISALITEALSDYLDEREEVLLELASMEEDYKDLGDEKLLSLCRERLSRLKTPLSQVIAEERDSR